MLPCNSRKAQMAPPSQAIPPRQVLDAGEGVRLRPVETEDAVALHGAARESIAEVSPWMSWCDADYGVEHARSWATMQAALWSRGEAFSFVIEEEGRDGISGTCGLNTIQRENAFCNLGYWVRTSRAKRGIASRAARRVAQFGMEEAGLGRIEIVVATGNVASQRAAEKAGAVREGVLRKRLVVRENVFDAVMFSITKP
jgi:RimJ/RimL family protein N-acetyltransferase